MIIGAFSKLPAEKRKFSINWASQLATSETIASTTLTPESGITLSGSGYTSSTVVFFAEGGTAGTTYTVACSVVTSAGKTLAADVAIRCSSVVVGTNSLASAEEADDYFVERNATAWMAGTVEAREAALIRATAHLNGYAWAGQKVGGRAQLLAWPRYGTIDREGWPIDDTTIPREVKAACCEIALRELATPGSMTPDVIMSQAVTREKIGAIEVQYQGAASADASRPVLTILHDLLQGLLANTGSGGQSLSGRLERV